MKKLLILLFIITVLTIDSNGQNVMPSNKSEQLSKLNKRFVYLNNIVKETQNDINNLKTLKGQEIYPDSASIFYQYEGDTMSGYIIFVFEDTLNIEEYYIQNSSQYNPYYKEEYHFDSQDKNTGYYITYYGDDNGNWIPDYKEDILYTICDVAGFRQCTYGIGKTYEWNNERKDWRGVSSSTLTQYDSFGRKIESANFKWDDSLFDWVYTNRTTWEYNSKDKVTREISYDWNTELDTIIPSRMEIFDYDLNDSIILECNFEWKQVGEKWDTIQKRVYSYSDNNIYQTFYTIDSETGKLTLFNFLREEYIYDGNNLLIRKNNYARKNLSQSWNLYIYDEYEYNESKKLTKWFSNWSTFQMQTIYNFNVKGDLILSSHYKRNLGEIAWTLVSEQKYDYDPKGNLLEQQHYYKYQYEQHGSGWKEINEYDEYNNRIISTGYTLVFPDSIFIYNRRNENLRNSLGLLSKTAEYVWDTTLNKWIGQYGLNEFFYERGLLKKTQYSEWNSETNEWNKPNYFETFFYKGLNLEIDSVSVQCSSLNDCSIKIFGSGGEGEYSYSIDNQLNWISSNSFENLQPGTYYIFLKDKSGTLVEYINNPIVISATSTNNIHSIAPIIFPNPFEDMFTIKVENTIFNVSIFNPMGQLIYFKEDVKSEQCIQLDKNKNGIYLIYIYTDKECFTKKIIKR